LHLKPLKAWRAFLGLRKSWLSREIVAFTFSSLRLAVDPELLIEKATLARSHAFLSIVTAIVGLFGVFCSAMVSHDTHQDFWRGELSIGKFFGTTAMLGLSTAWFASEMTASKAVWLPALLVVVSLFRLARGSRCFGAVRMMPIAQANFRPQYWSKCPVAALSTWASLRIHLRLAGSGAARGQLPVFIPGTLARGMERRAVSERIYRAAVVLPRGRALEDAGRYCRMSAVKQQNIAKRSQQTSTGCAPGTVC
jgi:hypothetical protein